VTETEGEKRVKRAAAELGEPRGESTGGTDDPRTKNGDRPNGGEKEVEQALSAATELASAALVETRLRITGPDASMVLNIPEKADPTEGTFGPYGLFGVKEAQNPGGNGERFDLSGRTDCHHHVHSVVLWAPVMLAPGEATRPVGVAEPTATATLEVATSFVQWSAVIGGALVALALSLVLIAFGSALGLGIVSSSPTWRDASPTLAVGAGIYLLLTALASFGLGGYVAGRLRERWHPTAHSNVVEFRDGAHGVLAWAIAAVVGGIIIAVTASGITSKAVEPTSSPVATAGEPLIAYELDRLFRAERHPPGTELTYARAEAARILLAAAGRQGIPPEDRTYLVRLVAGQTGAAPADSERRVDVAITASATAVHKARRSAVILGFSTAASLLFGAAAAWYAACAGGRHRDEVTPPLTWRWSS
jgi:hypothetical protein